MEHHQWLNAQRVESLEDERSATTFTIEKLRGMLEGGSWKVEEVPEHELERAALEIEKKSRNISEAHAGRAAALRALGKFFVKSVPFRSTEEDPSESHAHHPESDHARHLYG